MQKTNFFILASAKTLIGFCVSLFATIASANIIGNPVQNFNPSYSSRDFITVQSSSPLDKNTFHINYVVDYSKGTLPSIGVQSGRGDAGIYSSLSLGYGLTRYWDIGVSFPYILDQSLNETQHLAQFGSTGLLEARASSKVRLAKFSSGGGLAVLGHLGLNRTENLPYLGDNPGLSYALEVALDKVWGRWLLGANIGFRMFNPGEQFAGFTAFEPLENTMLASLAARYRFNDKWYGVGELWASLPDVDFVDVDREEHSLEALVGGIYKHKGATPDRDFNVLFGLTHGVTKGISTPEIRAFAGVNYIFDFGRLRSSAPVEAKPVEEAAPVEVAKEEIESFYNPGYRQGYLSNSGLGEQPYAGQDNGSVMNGGHEFANGFSDGYQEAVSMDFPAKFGKTLYAKGYHEGFNAKQRKGPHAEQFADKAYGAKLSSEFDFVNGYETGWLDAPAYKPVDLNQSEVTINDTNVEELVEMAPSKIEKINVENINFYFNSAVINEKSFSTLEKLLERLTKEEFQHLQIYGHTDNIGSSLYNEKLSLERARSVFNYLKSKEIPAEKMDFDGWGKRKPVVPNDTPANRYKNRRVEFIITR